MKKNVQISFIISILASLNAFSQSNDLPLTNKDDLSVKQVEKVDSSNVNTYSLKTIIKTKQSLSINNEASDTESKFQETKNELNRASDKSEITNNQLNDTSGDFETEYEYEITDSQLSSTSDDPEAEYEYEITDNQLNTTSDGLEEEYEYEVEYEYES